MEHPQVLHVPTCPEGALALGRIPCSACQMGWSVADSDGVTCCADTCNYIKQYVAVAASDALARMGEGPDGS